MGFKFRDIHSDAFTKSVRTERLGARAEQRVRFFTPELRDGSLELSDLNSYKRFFYEDMTAEVRLFVTARDREALEKKLGRLCGWLSGKGDLIFDALPFSVWTASCAGEPEISRMSGAPAAEVAAAFRMRPGCRCVYKAEEMVSLGVMVKIGSAVPIGLSAYSSKTFSVAAGGTELEVMNFGNMAVRPVIVLECAQGLSSVSVSASGRTLSYTGSAAAITADCGEMTVTDGSGACAAGDVEGSFLELAPGAGIVTVTAEKACEVTISAEPLFTYSADPEEWNCLFE